MPETSMRPTKAVVDVRAVREPPFHSILFAEPDDTDGVDGLDQPDCFTDLNLDQIVSAATAGREEYRLEPFFYRALHTPEAIGYRQDIFHDLDGTELFGHVETFAERMRTVRERLTQAGKRRYDYQRMAWFVDAAEGYCAAVDRFAADLARVSPVSTGFRLFGEYVSAYASGEAFRELVDETAQVAAALASIIYCVHIRGNRVSVTRYNDEPDYGAEVVATFERFKQQAAKEYRFTHHESPDMNHVEAQILDGVAQLFPEQFGALEAYCTRHSEFIDETIAAYDREVQFYTAFLSLIHRIRGAGLPFCRPEVSAVSKEVAVDESFELALAVKLVSESAPVVTNDFSLTDPERIIVVSGPNQGGKSTFARTFGQLHQLAALGCSVPGRRARLFLADGIYTHFEREEDIADLRGKLEDDLVHIHDILARAGAGSILIMNEIFTSTTLEDALFLGREVLTRVTELGALCVCVTFVEELSRLNEATVSMASTVVPGDPATRTFTVIRKPADGLSYAATLAEKYGLTRERLVERISR